MVAKYPALPEPTIKVDSIRDTVLSIKQAFEILTGQRGNPAYRAVLLPEITEVNARLADIEAQLAVRVFFSAQSGNAATAGSDVIFNTVISNVGSGYNSSDGRFTAPVAGVYYFDFHQLAPNADPGEYRTALYVNGAGYGGGRFITVKAAVAWLSLIAYAHIYLNVGDYVTVRYESGPAALYTDGNYSQFSGHLIK